MGYFKKKILIMEILKATDLIIGYKGKAILPPINVTLEEGALVALIGPNGSGKSTLFKMLNHNINDYQGNITIKDINIKDYSLTTLRQNILYVSQKEKIFSDTIYNNITLNKKIPITKLNTVLKI